VRFENYEQALACYEDPAYQASARDVVILEGP
jgi:uncharacterized protein (DUF1330 family)